MALEVLEGRWEEIERQASSLAGKRVRLVILPDVPVEAARPTAHPVDLEAAKARIRALDALAEKYRNLPALPAEAFDREFLYADDPEAA